MITKKYPDAYDVREIINLRTTTPTAVKDFAASKGLLVAGKGKDTYASALSKLLLDHHSYLNLRHIAQGADSRISVSGFNLYILSTPPKSLSQVYDDIMRFRGELSSSVGRRGARKSVALELRTPELRDDSIVSRYIYNRVVPGKIELLSSSREVVDFGIFPVSDRVLRVLCLPKYNQDVETLQKLFAKIDKFSYDVYTITLDDFPIAKRIEFFDRVLEHYSLTKNVGWKLIQVCGIVVRRLDKRRNVIFEIDSELGLEETMEGEERGEKKVRSSDLKSITRAALEGENLRTNSFVRDCEAAGFFFSSVTLELEQAESPEFIRVQLRFKETPKMFEVILHKTAHKTPLGIEDAKFSQIREQDIVTEFWNTAHDIWQSVKNDTPVTVGRQRQMVMNLPWPPVDPEEEADDTNEEE